MMTHFRASPFSRALADDLFSIVKNGNVVKKKKAILFSFFWPYFQIILKIIFCNNFNIMFKEKHFDCSTIAYSWLRFNKEEDLNGSHLV